MGWHKCWMQSTVTPKSSLLFRVVQILFISAKFITETGLSKRYTRRHRAFGGYFWWWNSALLRPNQWKYISNVVGRCLWRSIYKILKPHCLTYIIDPLHIFLTVNWSLIRKFRVIYQRFDALRRTKMEIEARSRGRTSGKCSLVAKAR